MGINVPKAPPDAYLMAIKRTLKFNYGFESTIYRNQHMNGELQLVIVWGIPRKTIKIPENSLGPARMMDFFNEFDEALRDKYPEVLL